VTAAFRRRDAKQMLGRHWQFSQLSRAAGFSSVVYPKSSYFLF
jgi:hypothetical protein